MGMIGTFDAFTTARLGIYAAQHGLRVTGNNISNLNTAGYTRQRIDQTSFKAGASDMYRSVYDNHVGNGALVTGINQIRDPYLDIRYRNTASDVGYYDTMLSGLKEIASILDEVGKGVTDNKNEEGDGLLYAQLQELSSALRDLSKYPSSDNDDLVRASAEKLTALFNTYADKLETLRKNTEASFKEDITAVNEILTNIRNLNESIRDNELHGDNALELRDERNRQIDALSEYMHIKVEYTMEDAGAGKMVEKLTISLGNANPDTGVTTDSSVLIDGLFGTQISVPNTLPKANPNYDPDNADPADPTDIKGFKYLKADGAGTNEAKDAEQLDNKNYILSLGKLYDQRGREWEKRTSTYVELTDAELANFGKVTAEKAVFKSPLTASSGWKDGDVIEVGGKTLTIGPNGDISTADMNDPTKLPELAKLVAEKLNGTVPGYTVTADGATLVYTAVKAGAIDPAAKPAAPTFTPGTGADGNPTTGNITFGARDEYLGKDGQAANIPADITTPNGDGTDTEIAYRQFNGKWYKYTTHVEYSSEVQLDDNDIYGSLQATRELLTEAGSFSTKDTVENIDENAAKKRGIPYYQKSLDLLAQKFAEEYNKLNEGTLVDQDGNEVGPLTGTIKELQDMGVTLNQVNGTAGGFGDGYYVKPDGTFMGTSDHKPCNLDLAGIKATDTIDEAIDKIKQYSTEAQNATTDAEKLTALKNFMAQHGVNDNNAATAKITLDKPIKMGGPLFSTRNDNDDPKGITASNISVSHSWSIGSVRIVPKFELLFGGEVTDSTQNTNINHMLSKIDEALVYRPTDLEPDAVGTKLFEGSFNDMLNDMCTILGNDQRIDNTKLNTHYTSLVDLDTGRDSVSGVDLNDETMNMMQYQKAYSAACRLMTAIDEALDRLINNTGIAGR